MSLTDIFQLKKIVTGADNKGKTVLVHLDLIVEIRKILEDNGADIHIISKIENQEGGLTSYAAVVGIRISLGIPVIVGVSDAMQALEDDLTVTIDTPKRSYL